MVNMKTNATRQKNAPAGTENKWCLVHDKLKNKRLKWWITLLSAPGCRYRVSLPDSSVDGLHGPWTLHVVLDFIICAWASCCCFRQRTGQRTGQTSGRWTCCTWWAQWLETLQCCMTDDGCHFNVWKIHNTLIGPVPGHVVHIRLYTKTIFCSHQRIINSSMSLLYESIELVWIWEKALYKSNY